MQSHQGRRVLVTAGAGGIGAAIAAAFHERGAHVHVCDISTENIAQFQENYPNIGISQTDVANVDEIERLFETVQSSLGGLDVLVNNAGISGPTALTEEISPADWDQTIAINISSHFYCARLAIPMLKAAGGGSIINISSTAGRMGYPRRSPYSASKWAIIGFTKTLAMELGEFNIRANAICPGTVEGPRIDRVMAAKASAQGVEAEVIREGYKRKSSLHTLIQASDIAEMALFLASDAGRRISGQAMSVDGHTETLRV
ncbi:MAG: SDR family oxidoreductase [Chloroflexota bacterium]